MALFNVPIPPDTRVWQSVKATHLAFADRFKGELNRESRGLFLRTGNSGFWSPESCLGRIRGFPSTNTNLRPYSWTAGIRVYDRSLDDSGWRGDPVAPHRPDGRSGISDHLLYLCRSLAASLLQCDAGIGFATRCHSFRPRRPRSTAAAGRAGSIRVRLHRITRLRLARASSYR